MTISEALSRASDHLERESASNYRLEAEWLLAFALAKDRGYLLAHLQDELATQDFSRYKDLIKLRSQGMPLQYILGSQEFRGLEFEVGPQVLIPRPETELAVEEVIHHLSRHDGKAADVGTGSGCIAVALAHEIEQLQVFATDLSEDALEVAKRNAQKHGVAQKIHFLQGDLLQPLASFDLKGHLDCVVCNPPYVSESEFPNLQREVRDWEPKLALVGGETGIAPYARLIPEAFSYLRPGGVLVLEIGYTMCETVCKYFGQGWELLGVREDLNGIPRIVVAQKLE